MSYSFSASGTLPQGPLEKQLGVFHALYDLLGNPPLADESRLREEIQQSVRTVQEVFESSPSYAEYGRAWLRITKAELRLQECEQRAADLRAAIVSDPEHEESLVEQRLSALRQAENLRELLEIIRPQLTALEDQTRAAFRTAQEKAIAEATATSKAEFAETLDKVMAGLRELFPALHAAEVRFALTTDRQRMEKSFRTPDMLPQRDLGLFEPSAADQAPAAETESPV